MFDGAAVHTTEVLADAGELVNQIGYVSSCSLIKEVGIYGDGVVLEPMFKGEGWNILSENHA